MKSDLNNYHQFSMGDLRDLWTLIKPDLHRALTLLPDSADQQSLRRYHEFVEHNELELACDALEVKNP